MQKEENSEPHLSKVSFEDEGEILKSMLVPLNETKVEAAADPARQKLYSCKRSTDDPQSDKSLSEVSLPPIWLMFAIRVEDSVQRDFRGAGNRLALPRRPSASQAVFIVPAAVVKAPAMIDLESFETEELN